VAVSGGTRVSQATSTAFVSRDELDVSGAARVGHAAAIVFRAGVRAVLSRADLLPLELYALGGTESVRGFREEQFRSWAVGWASLEPSFCMGSVSRVYPLADVGGYRDGDRWRPACGYGAGMRTAAGIGVVGLDYGVAFGDSPGRGKVHLSLQTEF
jgi:hemolysin activation/secretion protein